MCVIIFSTLSGLLFRAKWKGKLFIGVNSIKDGKPQDLELTSNNVTENVCYENVIKPEDHVISHDTSIKKEKPQDMELMSVYVAEHVSYESVCAPEDRVISLDVSIKKDKPQDLELNVAENVCYETVLIPEDHVTYEATYI